MSALTCPVCQGSFREVLREGILIDVCNQCRGVWLDRGELEKLLALSRGDEDAPPQRPQPQAYEQPRPEQRPEHRPEYRSEHRPEYRRDDDDDDRHKRGYSEHDYKYDKYGKKKKKGFDFGDIFDFGD